ncbi:MAG: NAD(P)H-dependent oxidoreductase subunit E [bacterium]
MTPSSASPAADVTGTAAPEVDLGPVDHILEDHQHDRTQLIAILLDLQEELGYLPVTGLKYVAQNMEVPLTEIYAISTFYKSFRLTPPGRKQITICQGTACHVRGSVQVQREFERRLGICEGETTPDLSFGLETVACVGACAIGPVVIVDDEYVGEMTPMKVPGLIRKLEKQIASEKVS